MLSFIEGTLPLIAGGIGLLILFFGLHEGGVRLKSWLFNRQLIRCHKLLRSFQDLSPEEFLALVIQLKNRYSKPVLEMVLSELNHSDLTPSWKLTFAKCFEQLEFVENYIQALRHAKSWGKRAHAAERLGQIGHVHGILPLLECFEDLQEDQEVRTSAIRALGQIRDPRAIDSFLKYFDQTSPGTAQVISDILVEWGDKVVPTLIQACDASSHTQKRYWLLHTLALLKSPQAVSLFMKFLSDPVAKIRAKAVWALGNLRVRESLNALSHSLLSDPVELVRDAAAEALGQIGDPKALQVLKEALQDSEGHVSRQVMKSLERMGEISIPYLVEAMEEGASSAAAALERMGVVADWVQELKDEKTWHSAYGKLLSIAQAGVVETLIRSLRLDSTAIRIRLCRLLSEIHHPRSLQGLEYLAEKDEEWMVRLEALIALIRLGNVKSIPLFKKALEQDDTIRERLLLALSKASFKTVSALLEQIQAHLKNDNQNVRLAAIKVLSHHIVPEILPALLKASKDSQVTVRWEAVRALRNFSEPHVVRRLMEALEDLDPKVWLAAVESLGQIKDPKCLQDLAKTFIRADGEQIEIIAKAVAELTQQSNQSLTDLMMGASHPKVRAGLAKVFTHRSDQDGVELLKVLLKDSEAMVRAAAIYSLGELSKNETAISLVKPYLFDPDEEVRVASISVLGSFLNEKFVQELWQAFQSEASVKVQAQILLLLSAWFGANKNFEFEQEKIKKQLFCSLQEWRQEKTDDQSQVLILMALALLQHLPSFGEVFSVTQAKHPWNPFLIQEVKKLSLKLQNQFLEYLSLERPLFFAPNPDVQRDHYLGLLRNEAQVSRRIHALLALGILKGPQTLLPIQNTATLDPDPQVREVAWISLGKILRGSALLRLMPRGLQDPAVQVQKQVLKILNRLPLQDIQAERQQLLTLLASPQARIRDEVSTLLAKVCEQDWQMLADEMLGQKNKLSLLGIIETLGKLAKSESTSLLKRFLKHQDPELRAASALALAELGGLESKEWLALLEDPIEGVRFASLRGLGTMIGVHQLERVSRRLQDPSPRVRLELAFTLAKAKLPKAVILSLVEQLKEDKNPQVRMSSLILSFLLGRDKTGEKFQEIFQDLEHAKKTLWVKRLENESVIENLRKVLSDSRSANLRKEAILFLSLIDLERSTTHLAQVLYDQDSDVRLAAVHALQFSKDPEVQAQIGALKFDVNAQVRRAVAKICE